MDVDNKYKKNIKNRIILIIAGVVLITAFLFIIFMANSRTNPATEEFGNFIGALYHGNYEIAEDLSTGTVKYNIATNKNNKKLDIAIIDVSTYVINANNTICEFYAYIEYYLQEEYYCDFIKSSMLLDKDGYYKVYKLENSEPYYRLYKNNKNVDITSAENTFIEYVKALESRKYKDAGTYLIGQAKTIHNATADILKDATLIKNPKDYKSKYLIGGNEYLKLKISYTNDNKNIDVIVSFFNTQEGWKIYDISQI